jgi:uncharacterized RDD family membrane protein YckC
MSNMPERDTPGDWGGGQGQPPKNGMPGQSGGQRGTQSSWGSRPANGMSPVNEVETRVTGRRIIQYLIDAFLVSLIPSLVSIPFDNSSRTSWHIIGGVIFMVLFILIGLWYWVIRPHSHNGQTFGMKLMGLRVISKDGGPANMTQLFIRWVCLIFDALPYTWPFTGLVGFIVILCSRHRQRIGDHLGRTLVIETGRGLGGSGSQFGGTGRGRAEYGRNTMTGTGVGTGGQGGTGTGTGQDDFR